MAIDPDEPQALLLYELFAAAGGKKHPPVASELAQLIAECVPPEMLAQVEQLYRALERAVAEGRPSDQLEDVFERARGILERVQ